uniref:YwiC-like family protein n=1 Tax=Streptomyces sp. NBC_00049 TaxID=2903617 RepID=A0AAU2JSX7_9ACTN
MPAVPFLAGTFLSPRPGAEHAALFAAWVLGYIAVFHAQQWLRLRTRGLRSARRHARPALVFGEPSPRRASRSPCCTRGCCWWRPASAARIPRRCGRRPWPACCTSRARSRT